MNPVQWVLWKFFRGLTALMFRVDGAELAKVPWEGPLIVVANHVHIPEIPTLYTRLFPRKVRGMVQAERVFDKNITGWILRRFGSIPVWRNEADLKALRTGIRALEEGNIVLIDPEGTRSHDGRLQRGLPGAILMALHSGAPLLPVVHYGSEHYPENLRRLRRTELHYVVGKPFRIQLDKQRLTRELRQRIIDQVMEQMAALLPAQYRGAYAGADAAVHPHLVFES
jgi:1-acyl-sn-glycerol-3-phosphate acyltransferase